MAEYQIPLSYVVSAATVAPSAGLEPLQLSTILLLTDEEQTGTGYDSDYMIARTATAVGQAYGTESTVYKLAQAIFSQNPNILNNGGYVIVANYENAEELTATAITRLAGSIYFEAVLPVKDMTASEATAASATVEAMPETILAVTDTTTATLAEGGLFVSLENNKRTRKFLFLTGVDEETKKLNAKLFAAAFLSRGLSVNYSGSNVALTMTYKDLAGVPVDTAISETILANCETVGVDVYCSVAGLAKVISFKQGGLYFDQLANQTWLTSTIQRTAANILFTTRGKIPQTTVGVMQLVNAVNGVLAQAVTAGVLAPGEWNSADTFGNLEDFHRGIRTFGYYTYFVPLYQQTQADREARKCPLIQIAGKEAGAIEHANILIYIEA